MSAQDPRLDPLRSLRWWMHIVRDELQVIGRELSCVIAREREGYYIQQNNLIPCSAGSETSSNL